MISTAFLLAAGGGTEMVEAIAGLTVFLVAVLGQVFCSLVCVFGSYVFMFVLPVALVLYFVDQSENN